MKYLVWAATYKQTKLLSYSELCNLLTLCDNRLFIGKYNLEQIGCYDDHKIYLTTYYNYSKNEFIIKLKKDIQFRKDFHNLLVD